MVAPNITDFGDESHEEGETGLIVDGFNFGFFLGEVWMFANADRSGLSDDLSTGIAWGEMRITGVDIPAVPNNALGAVFLAVKTLDNEWSSPAFPYPFTLVAAGAPPVAGYFPYMHNIRRRRA